MKATITTAAIGGGIAALVLATLPAGPYAWYVSRAAGLLSFVALTISMVLGLLISSRNGPRWLPKVAVFEFHQFMAVLGITLIGVHAVALLFDTTVPFGALDLLIPFHAPDQRFWVGAGVVAAWLSAAVAGSFWLKRRIGQKAWRRFHFASFAAYVLAAGHGIFAGTDTQAAPVFWGYAVSIGLVVSLLTFRILATKASRAKAPRHVRTAATPGARTLRPDPASPYGDTPRTTHS